ncbi:TIGR02646 family protein [Geitlerinema splendidum]|nr:TIGR02646 family protein [Geitlerinema splendidum]
MRYIQKGEEPEKLANWKALANEDWQPTYEELRGDIKIDLHDTLLKEQGYLCCYCEMRVTRSNSHIEHFKPRTSYPDLSLNYSNLLASCQREREPKEPQHCGVKKEDWYDEQLMVSPVIANCGDFFRYTGFGEILPTDDLPKQQAATATIKQLELNLGKLQNMRREAINGILQAVDGLSQPEIDLFLQELAKPDAEGKYTPFYSAIAYTVTQYYPTP